MSDARTSNPLASLLERLRADGGRYLLSVGLTHAERDAQPEPTYGGKGHVRWLTDEEYAALCSLPIVPWNGGWAIRPTEAAANAFWKYWKENGEPHVHGYYESTWGAINQALRGAAETTDSQVQEVAPSPHDARTCPVANCPDCSAELGK